MSKDVHIINAVPLPHPSELLIIESLDYSNPYDFQHLHRHDYFELILIKEGKGTQLIDFLHYGMNSNQVFAVYPGQVHLMHRNSANGLLIQFRKDIFEYIFPLKHFHLYHTTALSEFPSDIFSHLYDLAEHIQSLLQTKHLSSLSKHKAYNYLQIILISLVEANESKANFFKQHLVTEFLYLLSEHIYSKKKVTEYCEMIKCSDDRLNSACKKALGKTALQLIHEEMVLEIKRLLILNQLSLKEIAYLLNFDSQANFSGFIKARTNLSPKELQSSVREFVNQ